MSIIPEDKVREVRERAAILDVVSDYVRLKKSGANYLGLCPFHGEKTPSFNVNPAREIFHCFGCGVGGDVFGFVMRMEGLAFPEAVRFLARRVGVAIEDHPPSAEEKKRQDERETQERIVECAARFYGGVLAERAEGEPGRRYLAGRDFRLETVGVCRLGYAPDRWDALTRHLERQGIPLPAAERVGIIRRREGGGYYDIFRNRLLFTITDPHGHAIGFGGRVLDDSLPKYLNSSESLIYRKSEVLYGLDLAKQSTREKGVIFVVEGYFDHLALFQAGVRNVVATCGTALTPNHVKLLKRHAEKVYTLFDADGAGKKATFRAMDLFLEGEFPAHVVVLPPGEDPDSFVRDHGVDAFHERVRGAVPIFNYFFRELCGENETGSVDGKVKVLEALAPRLSKMANPIERDLYMKEISRVLGVEEGLLRKRVGRPGGASSPIQPTSGGERRRVGIGPEEMLLSLMGKYPEVSEQVRLFGAGNLFREELVPLAEAIISQTGTTRKVDWPTILDKVFSLEERGRLAALFVDDGHLDEIDAKKAFDQCRVVLERTALKEMKALARELAAVEPGSDRYHHLLGRMDSLRNRKARLN